MGFWLVQKQAGAHFHWLKIIGPAFSNSGSPPAFFFFFLFFFFFNNRGRVITTNQSGVI